MTGEAMASLAAFEVLHSGETVEPQAATTPKLNEVTPGMLGLVLQSLRQLLFPTPLEPGLEYLETRNTHTKQTDTPSDQKETDEPNLKRSRIERS